MSNRFLHRTVCRHTIVSTTALLIGLFSAALGQADTASWDEPDIDSWSYVNGIDPGNRYLSPSFGGFDVDSETDEFFEGNNQGPSRLASMLVAFETTNLIAPELDSSRYAISSVTVTVQVQGGTSGNLLYREQPITPAGMLSDALAGSLTAQIPMELFGVGFTSNYDGFGLGTNPTEDSFYENSDFLSASGYDLFPTIADDSGELIDVSNNITGGYSATETSTETAPFTATPWGIGTVPALNEGDVVPSLSTFTFNLNLSLSGIENYLQEGLANGSLGFFLSSMHPSVQPGTGVETPYPQWYSKEASALSGSINAPTLEIEYTILAESTPGDYDQDGDVDQDDYAVWTAAYGTAPAAPGEGADGNGDGAIDAADYTVWRDNYTAAPPALTVTAVPEPSTITGLLLMLLTLLMQPKKIIQ